MSGTPKKSSSSPYQVLGNRPIDQWKVTELKEELKRRKLITRGLKDELVKRLDEALSIERDNVVPVAVHGLNGSTYDQVGVASGDVVTPEKGVGEIGKGFETPKKDEEIKDDKIDDDWVKVDYTEGRSFMDVQNEEAAGIASDMVLGNEEDAVLQKTVVERISGNVVTETQLSTDIEKYEAQNDERKSQLDYEKSKSEISAEDCEGSEPLKHAEKSAQIISLDSTKLSGSEGRFDATVKSIETTDQVEASGHEDVTFSANQVSKVSPSLGLEVKSGSFSSISVTNFVKNEIKDNIIADSVKLKLNVKPKMVQPSSVNVAPDAGESHPMEVEDPLEKKPSADVKDGKAISVAKTNAYTDYPEKLNLDRSSGDDSMDEDAFDNKQIDTKTSSSVYEDKNEQVEVEIKGEIVVDVVSEGKENSHDEDKGVVSAEKRKLPGHQPTGITEPVKRQRRWNTDPVKVAEPTITAAAVFTTPKENVSPAVGRHGLLRSDSTNSEHATKERVVPPSANSPTNSLRIDRFLRPFTLKAVQELLGKTGKVVSFWMDQIKTHCYVTYSSVEEATETRNAVYNLQWPTNGGHLLIADFVDTQEVRNRVELPNPSPAAPISAPPQATASAKQSQPSPRQVQRQQPSPQTSFPPPQQLSAPPLVLEKPEPPIVTLDDLFRKTTSLPRIYYLPLSEEHVAEKLAAREKNIKA